MKQQTQQEAAARPQLPTEIDVRLYRPTAKGPVLADASVTLNGCFAIRGVQIRVGQNGPFVSPAMFREQIASYLRERIACTKKFTDAYYLHHSCGSVYLLVEDLIQCGVEILNPIQPLAKDMEPGRLKKEFGDRIVFHGGIDTQNLLPFQEKEQIRETVEQVLDIMLADGGYIFAAAHNIQEDVAPEKLAVMLETARKAGKRKRGGVV